INHTGQDVAAAAQGERSWGSVADRSVNPMNMERQQEDGRYWQGVGRQVSRPYREAVDQGRYGEAVGRGAVEVGSIFMGGGEANAVREAGAAGEVADAGLIASEAGRTGEVAADAGRVAEAGGDLAHSPTIPAPEAAGDL